MEEAEGAGASRGGEEEEWEVRQCNDLDTIFMNIYIFQIRQGPGHHGQGHPGVPQAARDCLHDTGEEAIKKQEEVD